MAVEIKEIVVRAVLTDGGKGQTSTDNDGCDEQAVDKKMIIQECVDQVLKVLKKKSLR
ncbi:DUF5908 family protein [Fulvivirga maritima]|uniref:DUF5908 family protein n=1 Tax=Fulvivirga maritima TaxID=2904247 RepID=UPI001F2E0E93|nr:DUF5908 family protein [Fulvivirga maritima]UII24674.1 DUF5908 family protein [Fulvivirga maritima]